MTRTQTVLLGSATLLAMASVATGSYAGPKKPKKPATVAAPSDEAPFDRAAASQALAAVDLVKCKSTNAPRGDGHVVVKFGPAGVATEAAVDKGPMMGTPVARCIVTQFKKAKVPAFTGDVVAVGKSFRFE
ncbi:MAG: hypothetical protein JWP97_1691 [Labilithrix sp.]|nr:hypothetical protein [Labilithrix sp.]